MYRYTIRIKEKGFTDNSFHLTISFREADGSEEEADVLLPNPYEPKTDALLEWYFEQYINKPYDDVKAKDAVNAIEAYGRKLFQNLFTGNLFYHYWIALQDVGPQNMALEIVGDSATFQSIYWESLWDPSQTDPLAAQGTVFLRKNVKSINIKATKFLVVTCKK